MKSRDIFDGPLDNSASKIKSIKRSALNCFASSAGRVGVAMLLFAMGSSNGLVAKEGGSKSNTISSPMKQQVIDALGGSYRYEQFMTPMRDGVRLATGVFLPEDYETSGRKHSTILCRSVYGIWSAANFEARNCAGHELVLVCQDLRGDGDSEGQGTANLYSFDNEIEDGYDTIEWIIQQPWSNGRVGMTGQSGHGFAAYMAYLSKHPNLVACDTNISGGNAHLYWTYHNGVKREMYYGWLSERNVSITLWPKPGVEPFDRGAYAEKVRFASADNPTVFVARTGWYDIFSESALDYFRQFGSNGKVFIQIDPIGHGTMAGRPFPQRSLPDNWTQPRLPEILNDSARVKDKRSCIVYYLMGDATDRNAPGNCFKITHEWPVKSVATDFFLHADQSVSTTKPVTQGGSLSFKYDPRDPVPSAGGDVFVHKGVGPKDQRVLSDRRDILRFSSRVLETPVVVTGKIKADLFVSTDVDDTTFTAKLIDIYPDGYQAVVRDSIVMGRFHAGYDRPSRMEKGKVYKLSLDMWSTAYAFNKGHRIGIHLSSSNSPKYEVHPNVYEPVDSFEESPIANNTIHLSETYPSHLTLPVVD
ncbi:MAG: CocE/NonD family hydrolase [Planctomycetota bacterium]